MFRLRLSCLALIWLVAPVVSQKALQIFFILNQFQSLWKRCRRHLTRVQSVAEIDICMHVGRAPTNGNFHDIIGPCSSPVTGIRSKVPSSWAFAALRSTSHSMRKP